MNKFLHRRNLVNRAKCNSGSGSFVSRLIGWKFTSFHHYLYRFAITGRKIWWKYLASNKGVSSSTREIWSILQSVLFQVPNSTQFNWAWLLSVCRLHLTCHAWFSFAAGFVGLDVLHDIFTVRWTSSPTTAITHSQVSMHQINTVLLSFIASGGCHFQWLCWIIQRS